MISPRVVQAVGGAGALLCVGGCVVGALTMPRVASSFAIQAAMRPWEIGIFIVALVLFGLLIIRRVDVRMLLEFFFGFFALLGVWFGAWWVWGEWGVVVAAVLTLAQAWVRTVWMHLLFVMVGVVGAVLYAAFLLPPLLWAVLFVILAAYDTVALRGKRMSERFARSVAHRGVIPLVVLPAGFGGFFRPLVEQAQAPQVAMMGVSALLFPGVAVAHLFVWGIPWAVAGVVISAIAGGWALRRGWSPLVPAGMATIVPLLLLSVRV